MMMTEEEAKKIKIRQKTVGFHQLFLSLSPTIYVHITYVPASVKVINVTAQSAILSVSPNSTEQYEREDWA